MEAREAVAAVSEVEPVEEPGLRHEPQPVSMYLSVAAALFVLTAFTVGIAQFHFGEWNVVVAMAVAAVKASLVVLFFMNLKYDHDRMNRVVFLAAIVFLVLYASLTLADQLTRGAIDEVRGKPAPVPARFAVPGAAPGVPPTEAPAAAPAPAGGEAAPGQ